MNNRWTKDEESKLLKLISSGKTYSEMAGGFNRSENALEMRVKKIIYENIVSGKEPKKIAELLNMSIDKIQQYHYSYKEYLEKENNKTGGGNIIRDVNINRDINRDNIESKMSRLENFDVHRNTQSGGNNLEKIQKLRIQNEKLKLLLENCALKEKLSKVMKHDKNIQNDILKALIDK